MARLARLEKETSEAKIAVALDAPRHQKLKELSEGIVEMYRVDPGLTGPLMEMVTDDDAGGYMTGSKMAKAAVLNTNGFQVQFVAYSLQVIMTKSFSKYQAREA